MPINNIFNSPFPRNPAFRAKGKFQFDAQSWKSFRDSFEVYKAGWGCIRTYRTKKYQIIFQRIMTRLERWKQLGMTIPSFRDYIHAHKKLVKNINNLYPSHLLWKDSYQMFFERGSINPEGIKLSIGDWSDEEYEALKNMDIVLDWKEASWADKYNQRR